MEQAVMATGSNTRQVLMRLHLDHTATVPHDSCQKCSRGTPYSQELYRMETGRDFEIDVDAFDPLAVGHRVS